MRKKRIEVGTFMGKKRVHYRLHHSLARDQFPHIETMEWVWHLWIGDGDDGYVGYFPTRTDAENFIASESLGDTFDDQSTESKT